MFHFTDFDLVVLVLLYSHSNRLHYGSNLCVRMSVLT